MAVCDESIGDSIVVGIKQLDKIVETKTDNNQQIFDPTIVTLYNSQVDKRIALIITKTLQVDPSGLSYGYRIENDSIKFTIHNASWGTVLAGSIDGDKQEDLVVAGGRYVNGQLQKGFSILSGNPLDEAHIRAWITQPYCGYSSSIVYVGDVNNDGIGDLAFGSSDGCFSIFLGLDWRKLSASNAPTTPDFTLHQSEPSPIGKDGMAVLPITLAHAGVYTLDVYDLTGKRIGEMFHGELPSGEVRLPLDVKSYNLSSGMFALRLTDGKHTRERAIVIQR